MGYEKVFEKPYSTGWKDLPDRTTPVTAAIMNDYDEAIEHIENHLNGSSAVFPIQATGGMTQPVGIDENGRLVTMPSSSGGETASEITYDNTESGLESTDVQGAIDELAAGAGEKVTPVPKTEDMTQEVGIDENGELWTEPGGGGEGVITVIDTIVEDAQISNTSAYMTANLDKNPFECKMLWIILRNASVSKVTNVFVDSIPQSGDILIDSTDICSSPTCTITLTTTTVSGKKYTGAFQDLYVDIYGIKEINSPTKIDTLFEDTTYEGVTSGTINLSQTVTDYDFINFTVVMASSGHDLRNSVSYDIDTITDYIIDSNKIMTLVGYGEYINLRFSDTQTITVDSVQNLGVVKIVGIKYGSSAENTWTKLLDVREESSQTASSYTLADDITNYNTIAVSVYSVINNMYYSGHATMPVDMIDIGTSRHNAELDHTRVCTFAFPTATSIQNVDQTGGTYVYQVYGK